MTFDSSLTDPQLSYECDLTAERDHLREVNAELLAALKEFEIEECPHCNGSGSERPTDKDDACHRCGGSGEILRGGWPEHVRSAIAKAEGR